MENISLEEWGTYDTISYVAAIHMLLNERELVFNEYENIVAPSITVENECWQVVKVKATQGSLVLKTVLFYNFLYYFPLLLPFVSYIIFCVGVRCGF